MLRSIVTLFLILSFSLVAEAHRPKRGKIFATAGPYAYRSFVDSRYTGAESPWLGGFSLFVEGDVDKNGGVEIGLTYLHQLYYGRKGDSVIVEKVKRVRATTGYRHWFGRDFSAGLFFTNAYSIGDVTLVHESGSPATFKTAANDISDNGMELSLQYEMIQSEKTSAIIDLRYTYSFSAASHEVPDVYGVIIGIKRFIQASEPDSNSLSE